VPLFQQRLLPLTPQVVARHLTGDIFIGLFPMLPDGTCWWLACDFDGRDAMLDAHAYVKAAASLGLPSALEVSFSGKGAHVWFFFTEPVSASDARALGTACLYRAQGLRGSMPLSSYDRLFPNQDTLPKDGAGNLIAAPLQGRGRKRGTSVFVDLAVWEPYEDQWQYLSTLDRISPTVLRKAITAAPARVAEPILRFEPAAATEIHPLVADTVRGVLSNGLTITHEDLSAELQAGLRNLATMRNPEFYKKERLRLSTYGVPRFLQGFDVTVEGDLILPRGLCAKAGTMIEQAGSRLVVEDARQTGHPIEVAFLGELSEEQSLAVNTVLAYTDGVLHAPTGYGKTVMACAVIAARAVSTVILVDKRGLADQWRDRVQKFLGIKPGQVGGGRKKTTGIVDIVLLPTLARRTPQEIGRLTEGYGQVIVDECHHLGATTYDNSVRYVAAAWWLGLSATPERQDGLYQLVEWQLGPTRHTIRDITPLDDSLATPYGGPERVVHAHETGFATPDGFAASDVRSVTALYNQLAADPERNQQIAGDVAEALSQGRHCLVLTQRVGQIDLLAELLAHVGVPPIFLRGDMTRKEIAASRRRIDGANGDDPLLVIGTMPVSGEGFDAPILDTLFLCLPFSYPVMLIQAAGRVMRAREGKDSVVVHDYVDIGVAVLVTQYNKRKIGYQQMGFASMPSRKELHRGHNAE
jgi:superfamily II DNA or RNA helicase